MDGHRQAQPYLLAAASVALVTVVTGRWIGTLGLASSALLFLLPVLLVSARGVGPGLFAAATGALAYNFFLLPPRYTLRVHGFDNVVSFVVLLAVALVTSRLATALKARQREAEAEAHASAEAAQLAALLAGREDLASAVKVGLSFVEARHGAARVLRHDEPLENRDDFGALDLSAAAWAVHNGDPAGHGTGIVGGADWTFLPLGRRGGGDVDVLAAVRPADGTPRSPQSLARLRAQAAVLGEARDRLGLLEERRARQQLEERDALRRTLLASLAHDFRTPLTVLHGDLESLAQESPGPAVERMLAQANRLDRMMDDLLGIARIEGGALLPAPEPVDLVDIVAGAAEAAGPALAGFRLIRDVAADLPLVHADPVLLRHVMTNLLDNAMHHAASTIEISAAEAGAGVTLTVSDDGPGIPAGEEAAIFDRFVRLAGGDRTGGSGLGLAIVKGFCDAMGIEVRAGNGPAGGARFTLTMPVFGIRS